MTCRRRTKKDRELKADIKKSASLFCQNDCYNCELNKYKDENDCIINYVKYIIFKEDDINE